MADENRFNVSMLTGIEDPTYEGGEVKILTFDSLKALDPQKIEDMGSDIHVVGGMAIRFSESQEPSGDHDVTGQWFSSKSYLGPRQGDGSDVYFNHGIPIDDPRISKVDALELSERRFGNGAAVHKMADGSGIWVECAIDMRKSYERSLNDMVEKGYIGWSSGSSPYLARVDLSNDPQLTSKFVMPGHIRSWPVVEYSFTPGPADPRNTVKAIKSVKSGLYLLRPDEEETNPTTKSDVQPKVMVDLGALKRLNDSLTEIISQTNAQSDVGDSNQDGNGTE